MSSCLMIYIVGEVESSGGRELAITSTVSRIKASLNLILVCSIIASIDCESWVDGVDIGIPTMFNPLLVIATGSNDLKISSDRGEYADFINEANMSDSVQTLINDINKQYEEAFESNQGASSGDEHLVWIPTNGGRKYHSYAGCSNMEDPIQVTEEEAIDLTYTRCEKCW